MSIPFTGTQAELADELDSKAANFRKVAESSLINKEHWLTLSAQWGDAAALVRNAIIVE